MVALRGVALVRPTASIGRRGRDRVRGTVVHARVLDRPVDSTGAHAVCRPLWWRRDNRFGGRSPGTVVPCLKNDLHCRQWETTRRERRDMRVSRSNRFLDRYRRNRFALAKNPPATFSVCAVESVYGGGGRGGAFRRIRFEKHVRAKTARNSPRVVSWRRQTTWEEDGRVGGGETKTPWSHGEGGFYRWEDWPTD